MTLVCIKSFLAIFMPNLKGGGAERVAVNLANSFVQRDYAVDMVLLSATGVFLADLQPETGSSICRSSACVMQFFRLGVIRAKPSRPQCWLACGH